MTVPSVLSLRPQGLMRWLGVPLAVAVQRLARLSSRRIGFALLYHRVEPQQGDPRGEIIPALGADLFAAQLRHLRVHYRVVSAAQLHAAVRERRRGQRFPVAVTFDDDHETLPSFALPALRKAGLTATFFLTGSSLDAPESFWWEDLQTFADGPSWNAADLHPGADRASDVHTVSEWIQTLAPVERRAVAVRLRELAGPPRPHRGLRRAGVGALTSAGCEIGFHTFAHEPLTTLDDAELAEAMQRGRPELEQAAGRRLTEIAYPHGKVDLRVAEAARQAGFTHGFTTEPIGVRPDSDPLLLGRLLPSFSSKGHFALQLARRLLPRAWPR
jgi:peptidoglycan/xylan/chitin deacetylase (PgdA/CDA1 family)